MTATASGRIVVKLHPLQLKKLDFTVTSQAIFAGRRDQAKGFVSGGAKQRNEAQERVEPPRSVNPLPDPFRVSKQKQKNQYKINSSSNLA